MTIASTRPPNRRAFAVAVTLVLLAALGAACGGADGGSREPGGPLDERIALVRDQRLLVRAADGAERTLFRAEASNVFPAFPAWSPDGTRIAFVQSTFAVSADGDWGDAIAIIDGSEQEPTVVWMHAERGEQVQGLAWSADGAALIAGVNTPLSGGDGGATSLRPSLVRIDLASGESSLLIDGALEPSLSRDGSRLAYLAPGDAGAGALWIAAPDGTAARTLALPEDMVPFAPRISPDGRTIAFAAPTDGAFSARPGSPWRRLADALPFAPHRAEAEARWAHGVPMEVWRLDLETRALTPLTSFAEDDPRSAWEPDGSALIVLATGGLYRVPLDGSGATRLDEGAFAGQLDVR